MTVPKSSVFRFPEGAEGQGSFRAIGFPGPEWAIPSLGLRLSPIGQCLHLCHP